MNIICVCVHSARTGRRLCGEPSWRYRRSTLNLDQFGLYEPCRFGGVIAPEDADGMAARRSGACGGDSEQPGVPSGVEAVADVLAGWPRLSDGARGPRQTRSADALRCGEVRGAGEGDLERPDLPREGVGWFERSFCQVSIPLGPHSLD